MIIIIILVLLILFPYVYLHLDDVRARDTFNKIYMAKHKVAVEEARLARERQEKERER